ncbi:c-type cytochrome [Candidatus Nitrospira bockiana]
MYLFVSRLLITQHSALSTRHLLGRPLLITQHSALSTSLLRLALLLTALACTAGCSEDMVEQPSYQAQEAPRRHSPPDSVPRGSRKLPPPLPVGLLPAHEQADRLFAVNCRHCHGAEGHGDGPVAGFLKELPKNLHSDHVQAQSEREVYDVITDGKDVMPSFRGLLSTEERWWLARYVKSLMREPSREREARGHGG